MSIFKLFRKKPEPIVLNEGLGEFILKNPEEDIWFKGEINWLGVNIYVSLARDSMDSLTANAALETLRKITANATEWDKKLKQIAAEDMCDENGMVETWEYDEKSENIVITKDEFLKRIYLAFIYIDLEDIHFDYSMDGMFTDHGYGIDTDLSGEVLWSGLWG